MNTTADVLCLADFGTGNGVLSVVIYAATAVQLYAADGPSLGGEPSFSFHEYTRIDAVRYTSALWKQRNSGVEL